MKDLKSLLPPHDLRTLLRVGEVVQSVRDQKNFDDFFNLLFQHEYHLVMRVANAVEKITRSHPQFLKPHKKQLLSLLRSTAGKELKWHVAKLIPRVTLAKSELKDVWGILTWHTRNPNESKIVRVNSLQALYMLAQQFPELQHDYEHTLKAIEHDPFPSIQARIGKLKKMASVAAKR